MTSWWVIGVLIVLTIVEILSDMFPGVNHVNDVIQSFIRPTAGAIVFAATATQVGEVKPVLGLDRWIAGRRRCARCQSPGGSPGRQRGDRRSWERTRVHRGTSNINSCFHLICHHPGDDRLYPDSYHNHHRHPHDFQKT